MMARIVVIALLAMNRLLRLFITACATYKVLIMIMN